MLWEHEPQASVSTAFSSSPRLCKSTLVSMKGLHDLQIAMRQGNDLRWP